MYQEDLLCGVLRLQDEHFQSFRTLSSGRHQHRILIAVVDSTPGAALAGTGERPDGLPITCSGEDIRASPRSSMFTALVTGAGRSLGKTSVGALTGTTGLTTVLRGDGSVVVGTPNS